VFILPAGNATTWAQGSQEHASAKTLEASTQINEDNKPAAEPGSPAPSTNPDLVAPQDVNYFQQLKLGINGHVRLGCWAEATIRCPTLPQDGTLVIRSTDGDGIPVNFRWPLSQQFQDDGVPMAVGYFRMGRPKQELRFQVLDKSGKVLAQKLVDSTNRELITVHPATSKLWIYLGPELGLNSALGLSSTDSGNGGIQIIPLESPQNLPATALGWDSVVRLAGCPEGEAWPDQLSDRQMRSISTWLKDGGHVSLTVAESASRLIGPNGVLNPIFPPQEVATLSTENSSSIEFFVTSRSQLLTQRGQTLTFAALTTADNDSELMVDDRPAILRFAHGRGQVDVMGLNPMTPTLAQWPSRGALLAKWLQHSKPSEARLNTSFGFNDLTGQLRSALDQFKAVQLISFTTVSLIVLAFILFVTLDYFLLRYILGKMELTWITLPIYCLVACGATYAIFQSSKSDKLLVNQAEIIDIDASDLSVRGHFWANVYSPVSKPMKIDLATSNQFDIPSSSRFITWQGLSGIGMGAMRSENLSIGSDQPYSLSTNTKKMTSPQLPATDAGAATGNPMAEIVIENMPFNVASTRCLTGTWGATFPKTINAKLQRQSGRDRLSGTFTNPFPVELKDCFIVYGPWAYQFNQTLPPGKTIDLLTQAKPQAIQVWLTRSRSGQNSGSGDAGWSPVNDDLQRILEMLMYYDLAGGQGYTRLLNSYQSRLDFSHLNQLRRAVFLGRCDSSVAQMQFDGNTIQDDQYDKTATAVRIILPVLEPDQD